MKQYIVGTVFWVLTAMLVGTVAAKYFVAEQYSEFADSFKTQSVGETNINLSLANALHMKEYKYLLEHYEALMEINALSFTKNGEGVAALNENDLCVLKKVKKYWEEKCDKKCFPELAPILINLESHNKSLQQTNSSVTSFAEQKPCQS